MKVIIAGPRNFEDYDVVDEAIKKSGFEVTEVVSGNAKGVDQLGEMWARANKKKLKLFPADWNNLKQPGARVKTNKWNKKYNANAANFRDKAMLEYADALIFIKDTGSDFMVKKAKNFDVEVYVYDVEENMLDEEFGYIF